MNKLNTVIGLTVFAFIDLGLALWGAHQWYTTHRLEYWLYLAIVIVTLGVCTCTVAYMIWVKLTEGKE